MTYNMQILNYRSFRSANHMEHPSLQLLMEIINFFINYIHFFDIFVTLF